MLPVLLGGTEPKPSDWRHTLTADTTQTDIAAFTLLEQRLDQQYNILTGGAALRRSAEYLHWRYNVWTDGRALRLL